MSRIKLSDHFSYTRLARFVLPSIGMMVFTSIYGIVDGFFVSNYVGKTAFAAVNLDMPYLYLISALGFMIGTGGSALVAMQFGEGRNELANQTFTMLVRVLFISSTIIAIISAILMPQIAMALGAKEGQLLHDAVLYGRLSLISMPMFMLQNAFQSFMVTAEKPNLGLGVTIGAGVANMVLDVLFVGVFGWGLTGAALATVTAEFTGGLLPVIYFARQNDSLLAFVPAPTNWKHLGRACYNGMSELMQSIAGSIVSIAYNLQLLKYLGENGVAAYGVIMYVNFIFVAIFLGYMMGSAPLYSYNYGAENYTELRNLFHKALVINGAVGTILCLTSFVLAPVLSGIFVSYDAELLELTIHAMRIMSIGFIYMGIGIFGSGFFTALGNGTISALLAFSRTIVFQLSCVLVLPLIIDVDGIWIASPASGLMAATLTAVLLVIYRKKYRY